jgi:hypothetical protein
MTASELKSAFVKALASGADARLAEVGFVRSPKGTTFVRTLPEAVQVFDISLALHPPYDPKAIAHVYPRVRLSIRSVSEIAEKLVAENPVLLAHAPDVLVNRPLEHLVPKTERIQWYAYRDDDFHDIATSIATQCLKWGLPFFDDYRTALDVVRGHESGDDRPRAQENWSVFVIAAYVALGRRESALETANRAFGPPGLRRKYAAVFAALDRLPPMAPRA